MVLHKQQFELFNLADDFKGIVLYMIYFLVRKFIIICIQHNSLSYFCKCICALLVTVAYDWLCLNGSWARIYGRKAGPKRQWGLYVLETVTQFTKLKQTGSLPFAHSTLLPHAPNDSFYLNVCIQINFFMRIKF